MELRFYKGPGQLVHPSGEMSGISKGNQYLRRSEETDIF